MRGRGPLAAIPAVASPSTAALVRPSWGSAGRGPVASAAHSISNPGCGTSRRGFCPRASAVTAPKRGGGWPVQPSDNGNGNGTAGVADVLLATGGLPLPDSAEHPLLAVIREEAAASAPWMVEARRELHKCGWPAGAVQRWHGCTGNLAWAAWKYGSCTVLLMAGMVLLLSQAPPAVCSPSARALCYPPSPQAADPAGGRSH